MPYYFSAEKSGSVREHVYFYQEYHKVCVLKWAVVHHIDPVTPNYCNNMPWNLQTMMRGEHIGMHKKGNQNGKKDMSGRLCIYPTCKNPINPYRDREGQPRWYKFKNGFICNPCYHMEKRKPLQAPTIDNIIK